MGCLFHLSVRKCSFFRVQKGFLNNKILFRENSDDWEKIHSSFLISPLDASKIEYCDYMSYEKAEHFVL